MQWRLKRGVSWHDGRPFTADDVIFTWQYASDPASAATSTGSYLGIERAEKIDDHTVKLTFKRPTPFWPTPSAARPASCCRDTYSSPTEAASRARRQPTSSPSARALSVRRLQAGRHRHGRDQFHLPRAEPPLLRHRRTEGRGRSGVGGARGAADWSVRLRLGPRHRGRDPSAPRGQRQRARCHRPHDEHRLHPAEPGRSVARRRRRASEHQDRRILSSPIRPCARRSPCSSIARRSRARSGATG